MRTLLLLMLTAGMLAGCKQTRAGDIAAPETNGSAETTQTASITDTEQAALQWLTGLFTCAEGDGYCFPELDSEFTTRRLNEFWDEAIELYGGYFEGSNEKLQAAIERYRQKWNGIYPIKEDDYNYFGVGNGDTEKLNDVRITSQGDLKFHVFIDFGYASSHTDVTLVKHADGFLIDYMKVNDVTIISSDYLFVIAVGSDDGRQMLVVSETDEDDVFAGIRPDSITTCFHNGRLYPVRYVGKQKRSDESTGRETTQNFRNLGGYVYELISDRLPLTEDEEYMYYVSLSDRKFAGDFSVVEMQHYTARDDEGNIIYDDYALRRMEQTRGDLAKRYGRKIKTVEVVAATSDGEYFVYSVQFENKGTQALGLVAIETPEGYSILEEPAEYNEISTWRADDEGSYYPPYVAGLFRKYDGSLLILLERSGADGSNFELYVVHEDGKLKRYDRAWYFYAAPI